MRTSSSLRILVALASLWTCCSFASLTARNWAIAAQVSQRGRQPNGLASAATPDALATPVGAVPSDHKFMTVPPVRAFMLSTAWKNDAENLRALG